ncbi:MAG: YlmC/YmxH family sporulation protein [Bacillota bacterium]|jgi:YlmC/YmxH family sporulation protein|nr:YlmC/YmxH family sporulation protein [Bacillota bacterium]HOB91083.1 YlmC/YmxH family sporulation protein [Bacillota bacterium]HPZ54209.1 YlmC/YmxH family sporulation protein [Bacillota bacterium]HQD18304.1 YlmC/YmxH family sporulation protein [Bacillota bacterium]
MLIRTSDLKVREVINIRDGRNLGVVTDIEFDMEKGAVQSIIVPGEGRLLGLFGRRGDVVIPWHRIRKFGEDAILVDVDDFKDE